MKKLIVFGLAFITLTAFTGGTGSEENNKTADGINWVTMEEAIQLIEAGGNNKLFFVDVYTDWCGWCKRMDATTFQDPNVIQVMNDNFIAIKFDGEAQRDIALKGQTFKFIESGRRGYHELAAALLQNKLSYPTVVFLDENFNMIQPLPGYRTGPQFLPILKFLGEKHYENETWEQYVAKYSDASPSQEGSN
ncbi:MAG: DUF255 domain-containing protein [Bacteroidota bacterium]